MVAAWLVAGLPSGTARARPGSKSIPWVSLLVVAADSSSEQEAARVYRIVRVNLEQTRTLVFMDADGILADREPDADPMATARALFEKGRRAYDNLELAQAVKLLRKADAELERHLDRLDDLELFTDIHIYLGAALELRGEQQKGRAVFRELVVINPDAELDPVVFPPALAAVFKQVRSQVARAGTGSLHVEATGGTEVWIDAVYRGISPVHVDNLVEGRHLLQLIRRGHQRFGGGCDVLAGTEELIQKKLQPLPGWARLRRLGARMAESAGTDFPTAAGELLAWLKVDRLIFVAVEVLRDSLVVRAHYFDGHARRCLKAREKSFNPLDDAFEERLELFITSLYMDVGGEEIASAGGRDQPVAPGVPLPPPTEEQGDRDGKEQSDGGIWTSWWFWTVAGVVVAGGTGLALALTLGSGHPPADAEVVFRF